MAGDARGRCASDSAPACGRGRGRGSPETLPVRFDRRRVYVLPTGFGLFFSLLLLAMWLGALNYNNNPALMLGLLLAGAANTSLLAAHLQLTGLQVSAIDAEPVPAGATLEVRLHVRADPGRARRGLRVECEDATACCRSSTARARRR